MGEVAVDARYQDFFRAVVEERKRSDRAGLDSRAKGLKVLANATSYGIYAQMTRHELSAGRKEPVTVYSESEEPWQWPDHAPEDPGDFCFPPLAASITGAARLMLTLLERQVTDLGGSYAFCDTDSMAIVASNKGGAAPGAGVKALTWDQVDGIQQRFESLKPYSAEAIPGPLLELEDENFADEKSRQTRRQLWCYSISAKRYVLYNRHSSGPKIRSATVPDGEDFRVEDGDVETLSRKPSQHGLGHLMNPINPESEDRSWIEESWRFLLGNDLGSGAPEPDWLDKPALTQSTISTPRLRKLFKEINAGRPYAEQVKPFNFMLIAFVPAIERPADEERIVLVAPYER